MNKMCLESCRVTSADYWSSFAGIAWKRLETEGLAALRSFIPHGFAAPGLLFEAFTLPAS